MTPQQRRQTAQPSSQSAHGDLRVTRRSERPSEDRHRLSVLQGLAALSLDALSSVAYRPEAIVLVLGGRRIKAPWAR